MVPNPVLVSNAYIMEAVQPQTLEEPVGKSTILYANRFAGVQEVDVQDPTLLEILNSTIGTSGNNVLVQLNQKMKAYPGGPWYIDSNDGVVHVHNRKFTNKTAHVYTYMAEPGEVLSASFRIVEVYKQDTAGLAAYVNAVNKTVSALLNPQVENPPERPHTVDPSDFGRIRGRYVCEPDKTRVDDTRVRVLVENYRVNQRVRAKQKVDNYRFQEWSSKTPQQRQAIRIQYSDQAWDRAVGSGLEDRVREAPEYRNLIIKWDYYKQMCEEHGSNSPQAKKAWQEYKGAGADRAYISGINTQPYWDWHEFNISVVNTYQYPKYRSDGGRTGINNGELESSRKRSISAAIRAWKFSHSGRFTGELTIIKQGTWSTVSRRIVHPHYEVPWADEDCVMNEKCTIRAKAYSLFSKPYKYPLSRLLGEYTSSGSGSVSNPLAVMQQAAANIGRGKKEKQLQATIRVIGNPELESTQQFTIQNVGKKYSGVWYITSVVHTFEHDQGYTCDLTLSKQRGKSKVSGTSDEINTRNYTSGSGGKTTSKKGRPKANRVPSDKYTYQDAMNEQWTAEEALYIKHAVMSQPDEASARRTLEAQSYNVADKNMYNHQNNTSSSYVTIGNGTVSGRYSHKYSGVKREKVRLPQQALKVLEDYKRNKGK